jgi:hypothetical protein
MALPLALAGLVTLGGPAINYAQDIMEGGSGIAGLGRLAGAFAKYGTRLALRSDGLNERAVRWIVDDMRARVPVDTGALLNSIRTWREGRFWVVTADASNPRDGSDYGYWVEYGTAGGERGVSRTTFASAGDPSQRISYRTHPGTEAQPFFWPAIEAGVARRNLELDSLLEGLPEESGLH